MCHIEDRKDKPKETKKETKATNQQQNHHKQVNRKLNDHINEPHVFRRPTGIPLSVTGRPAKAAAGPNIRSSADNWT